VVDRNTCAIPAWLDHPELCRPTISSRFVALNHIVLAFLTVIGFDESDDPHTIVEFSTAIVSFECRSFSRAGNPYLYHWRQFRSVRTFRRYLVSVRVHPIFA
jgi:hypothetical protein